MNSTITVLSINIDNDTGAVKLINFAIDYTRDDLPGVKTTHGGSVEPKTALEADASDFALVAAVASAIAEQIPMLDAIHNAALEREYMALTTTVIVKVDEPVTYPNISARQLWLAALDNEITKAQVVAKIDGIEDEKLKARLNIEITEPPLEGYARDSDAVEQLRALMAIDVDVFNTMWLAAAKL